MTSEIRNSVPLNEMPIEDLATVARKRISQVELSLADEDRRVDKSITPVKRAISNLEFLNDSVVSVPEISTYFKRTNKKVILARGLPIVPDVMDIHIQEGEVRFNVSVTYNTDKLPGSLRFEDHMHFLLTPELIEALYDQNRERYLIKSFAGMSRLKLLKKVQSSIH